MRAMDRGIPDDLRPDCHERRARGCDEGSRRTHVRLALPIAAAVAAICLPNSAAHAEPTPFPTPASAVGNEMVQWLVVSPAYQRTGLVVAQTSALQCSSACIHLWISRDGGGSWHRAAAQNWQPGRIAVAIAAAGHERLFSAGSYVQQSDDDGQTWRNVGPSGSPTPLVDASTSGGVAVAAAEGGDYILRETKTQSVTGSGGDLDFQFTVSPEFPTGGSYSPALLLALDPHGNRPILLHCSMQLTCSNPVPFPWPPNSPGAMVISSMLVTSADYAEHGSVFAATPFGLAKSADGGNTFTTLPVVSTAGSTQTAIPMIALAPGYREHGAVRTIYAAVFQAFMSANQGGSVTGGIYRSGDGGTTWSPMATSGPFGGGAQAIAAAPSGRMFAGFYDGRGHAGLLCSDGGASWQPACSPTVTSSSSLSASNRGSDRGAACNGCTSASPSNAGAAVNQSNGVPGQGSGVQGGVAAAARAGQPSGGRARSWLWLAGAAGVVLLLLAAVRAGALPRMRGKGSKQ